MDKKQVQVSDGGRVEVRPLFLYEDDVVPFDDPGDFVMHYALDIQSGQTEPVIHTLADFPSPPAKPTKPRELCEPGSVEFDQWSTWTLYQAIIAHETERLKLAEKHAHDIARYVLDNCLSPEDRQRIITAEDLAAVLAVALTSEVKLQDIETVLEHTFQGAIRWAAYIAGHLQFAERERQRVGGSAVVGGDTASVAA